MKKRYFFLVLSILFYSFSFLLTSFSNNLILISFWLGLVCFYLLWKQYPSYNYLTFILFIFRYLFEFRLEEATILLIILCVFGSIFNRICMVYNIDQKTFSKFRIFDLFTILVIVLSFFVSLPFYYVTLIFSLFYTISFNIYSLILGISLFKLNSNNILVLDTKKYQDLSISDGIIFTKTGVVTLGEFEIEELEANNIKLFWEYLSLAQSYRNDRIASYIKNNKKYVKNSKLKVSSYKSFYNGISYKVGHKNILVGDKNFLLEHGITVTDYSKIGTIIYVYENKKVIGYVILNDKMKVSTKEIIYKLSKMVNKIILFSKDQERLTTNVARTLGVTSSYGELTEKNTSFWLYYIKNQIGDKLVIISDNSTDYDVNTKINMGTAFENNDNSDIIILNNKLEDCLMLFELSYKLKTIKRNIIWGYLFSSIMIILSGLLWINKIWVLILFMFSIIFVQVFYYIKRISH